MKRVLAFLVVSLLAALVVAACGGNGGSDENGNGDPGPVELTDPGDAPTAEPIEEGRVYVIRDNNVTAPGGASTTVPDRGSIPLDGEDDAGGDDGEGTDSGTGFYTVQQGDTCSAISAATGATLDQILELNPSINADCSNLTPGDNIRVPGSANGGDEGEADDSDGDEQAEEPTEPADDSGDEGDQDGGDAGSSGQTYEIQPGDICGTIAEQFGVDVDELVALNGLDCTNLQVGETIQIPE